MLDLERWTFKDPARVDASSPTCEKNGTNFGIFTYAKIMMDVKSHTSPCKNKNPIYHPVISVSPKSASKRVPLGHTLGDRHWSVPAPCLFSSFSKPAAQECAEKSLDPCSDLDPCRGPCHAQGHADVGRVALSPALCLWLPPAMPSSPAHAPNI